MRIFVALSIIVAVLYFWDVDHNNGQLLIGFLSMERSIAHNVGH
jgi:hypothetical protein